MRIPREFIIPKGAIKITPKDINAEIYVHETNGKLYAIGFSGKSQKPDFNGRFGTAEFRERYIKEYIDKMREIEKRRTDRKAERASFYAPDHVKVGDLFVHSWGYDQTNTEYFQVVSVGAKTVKVRQIASETVEGSQGFMSESRRPIPDKFLDKTCNFTGGRGYEVEGPLTARVYMYGTEPHLTCEHGSCSRISADSSHYRSWYA